MEIDIIRNCIGLDWKLVADTLKKVEMEYIEMKKNQVSLVYDKFFFKFLPDLVLFCIKC